MVKPLQMSNIFDFTKRLPMKVKTVMVPTSPPDFV